MHRRVDADFNYDSKVLTAARMEKMLTAVMRDPDISYSASQEIAAYLYPDMSHYHIDDLKRRRVDVAYDLATVGCAALHFPGGMWCVHSGQIELLGGSRIPVPMAVRYSPTAKLSRYELWRMRIFMTLSKYRMLRTPMYL
jgi:hypothetical protein